MIRHRRHRLILVAALLGVLVVPLQASDHADPIDLFMRHRLEPGLTDLFFFPAPDNPNDLVVILCTRRALTKTNSLKLEPYTFKVHMDLNTPVGDDQEAVARYGGSIAHPDGLRATATMAFQLNDNGTIRHQQFDGFQTTEGFRIWSGVRDDPFIFPPFFRTNVVAIVVTIPRRAFPANQQSWIMWGTSERDGKQIDHVGRSLRTQHPRFELLNTLPPSQHRAAIQAEHENPGLMRQLGSIFFNLPSLFAYRTYDFVPDVLIYKATRPFGYPNGRYLTDDVAELLAQYGDTLLKEISYINGGWPRRTTNDKPFSPSFPYLAEPWPDRDVTPPGLSTRNKVKLAAIGIGIVLFWALTAYLFALWYHRRKLRLRYA